MFDEIMVPVDFSEHSALAFGHAGLLARAFGGRLGLVHVVEQVVHSHPSFWSAEPALADELHRESLGAAEQHLEALAHAHAELGPSVHARVVSGSLPGALADHASLEHVDLIVMSTHGRTGFARWLMGSVTERVLRVAPCSVLVVRGKGHAPPGHAHPGAVSRAVVPPAVVSPAVAAPGTESAVPSIQRIIVAVDLSDSSRGALLAAGRLAAALGASLEALHVSPLPAHAEAGTARAGLGERLHDKARSDLDAFIHSVGLPEGIALEATVVAGTPTAAISERVLERHADLLVLGTHGYGGVKRLVLGSVAEALARYSSCATLVVR